MTTLLNITDAEAMKILEFAHRHRLTVDTAVEALAAARAMIVEEDGDSTEYLGRIQDFHRESIKAEAGASIMAHLVYSKYCLWCEKHGEGPVSLTRFGLTMTRLGVEKDHSGRRSFYLNIRVEVQ